jgi:hypothetical protein
MYQQHLAAQANGGVGAGEQEYIDDEDEEEGMDEDQN